MTEEMIAPARPLLLDSLEIQNFRAFRHLRIEQLGRVNLITGKNNVGKTSLLEALCVYATGGRPTILRELLLSRNELEVGTKPNRDSFAVFANLFHGHPHANSESSFASIGSVKQKLSQVTLNLMWLKNRSEMVKLSDKDETYPSSAHISPQNAVKSLDAFPTFFINPGGVGEYSFSLSRFFRDDALAVVDREFPDGYLVEYLSAKGNDAHHLVKLWNQIVLTTLEDDVVLALRLIAPEVFRVSVIGTDEHPIPVVAYGANRDKIPLQSLGDGMNRLFGISLSLTSVAGGFLLIDEIENGLHYSVLTNVWKMIFETAKRLNVQVFATTHSWDCIEAFQQAAAEDGNEEAMLIRLQSSKDGIKSVLYDERRLGIATREQIEVR